MATTQVKNGYRGGSDDQLLVLPDGSINVNPSGGGGGINNAWTAFGQSTPKQVSVANISTQILAANNIRIFARISNNSPQTIYLQYGINAVWQTGLRMSPGAALTIDTTELYQGPINAITQTGSVNIDVIEGVVI